MESMRLSSQLVGFWSITAEGCACVSAGKKKSGAAQPVSIHGGRRSLPGRRAKPAFVWGQSVRLCLVADSQPHARTTLTVRGLCAREHATHSPDTGHIEVQARTTHTFTHAYRHTHMPHAFTHTEQIKQVDCTAQCRRVTATSGFKICLSFLVMDAKGFFPVFFFRLNEGFRKLNKCLFRACLWLRNCANTLLCAFLSCGPKKPH